MLAAAVSSAARSPGESAASRAAHLRGRHGVVLRRARRGRAAPCARARRRRRGRARRRRWPRPPPAPRRPAAPAPAARATVAATSSFQGSCLISPPATARRRSTSASTSSRRRTRAARAATRRALQAATTSRSSQRQHPAAPGAQARAQLDDAVGEAERRAPAPARRARAMLRLRAGGGEVPPRGLADTASRSREPARPAVAPGRSRRTRARRGSSRRSSRSATPWRALEQPVAADHAGVQRAAVAGAQHVRRRAPSSHAPAACRSSAGARSSRSEAAGRPAASSRSRTSAGGAAGLAGEADPHPAPSASAISRAPPVTSRPSARRSV